MGKGGDIDPEKLDLDESKLAGSMMVISLGFNIPMADLQFVTR
jgi:hypothetical protein